MNIDIRNYGHFRLTDYNRDGMRPSLFNRNTDQIVSITMEDFRFITLPQNGVNSDPVTRCEMVMENYV